MSRNFRELLEAKWDKDKFVCVGLDSDYEKIPAGARGDNIANDIADFNHAIIEATHDLVSAYKPNIAFYEAHGPEGIAALHRTIVDIHAIAPDVPVILDAKRADIGNTNKGYAEMAFELLKADAITVHPYLGSEAMRPFLDYKDKGIIVLCRTSNSGSGEFQNRQVIVTRDEFEYDGVANYAIGDLDHPLAYTMPFYKLVAHRVAKFWNQHGNCSVVAGATYPDELAEIRKIVGDMPILIPGIGKQGGDVEKTVSLGRDSRSRGMIINSSSGIIFASNGPDFAEAARRETEKLHNQINQYLRK